MNAYNCVRCGGVFMTEQRLSGAVFCPACNQESWTQGVERGRRLRWYDDPSVQGDTPADQHLRAVNAPRLFE
jgi:uncharacterized Zn finger protein (UPF0148 family)